MFSERRIVIGRDPTEADLVLESSQVSRKHAIIEHDGVKVVIRDAGSTNGIFVNNKKVKSANVTRLDEVLLGDFSLKVKTMAKEMEVPASPPPPTRVASSIEELAAVTTPRSHSGASDRGRREKPEEAARVRPKKAGFESEFSDWDDISDSHQSGPHDDLRAQAEFRDRPEVMDRNRFGEVLKDIGIAPREKSDPRGERKAKDKAKAKPKAKPKAKQRRPSPELDDELAGAGSVETPLLTGEELSSLSGQEEESWREQSSDRSDEPSFPPPANLDDDDDDDANYVPPYSLVAQLLQEDAVVNRERRRNGKPVVEVLTLAGDSVIDAQLLKPGQSFWIGPRLGFMRRRRARDLPRRVRLLKYRRNGDCRIEVRKQVGGTLQRGKQRIKLDAASGHVDRDARRGTYCMDLKNGEILDITDSGRTYHVRFAMPPLVLKDSRPLFERLRPDKWIVRAFGGSAIGHVFIMLLFSIIMPAQALQPPTTPTDEFVEVTVETDVALEEPVPEPEPEPEPVPEKTAKHEKVPPKMQAAPSKKKPRHGGTSKAPPGVLGLLNKKGSSAVPGPAAAVAAVSNLSAAKVPGGRSGYRVSGLIGKLPTSSLSVGGGGGGLMTRGGATLLRGGGGAGRLSGKGTRGVGGLVQKNPKALKPRGQGHLDRDEIQKVINANIGQIQRCYERELLKISGLSGKIQVEWNIATSGSVRIVRQVFTSMKSTNVSNCIMGAIRRWKFPRPRGGEVIVNYPFIFKSIGF